MTQSLQILQFEDCCGQERPRAMLAAEQPCETRCGVPRDGLILGFAGIC